jgi:DNA-binding NtrC family response regulator
MERISLLCEGRSVLIEHVDAALATRLDRRQADRVRPLAEVEREAIESALLHFGENRTRTARALGISRRTLQTKLKKYAEVPA